MGISPDSGVSLNPEATGQSDSSPRLVTRLTAQVKVRTIATKGLNMIVAFLAL